MAEKRIVVDGVPYVRWEPQDKKQFSYEVAHEVGERLIVAMRDMRQNENGDGLVWPPARYVARKLAARFGREHEEALFLLLCDAFADGCDFEYKRAFNCVNKWFYPDTETDHAEEDADD